MSAANHSRSQSILVGLDGTPGAQRALEWAATTSRDTGADLVAIHVLTYSKEFNGDLSLAGLTNWRRTLRRDLAGAWTERARALGASVRTRLVEADSVADGLLSAAALEQPALVVLGTHGPGTVADRIFGATTYRVSHRATAPVVIISANWVSQGDDPGTGQRTGVVTGR